MQVKSCKRRLFVVIALVATSLVLGLQTARATLEARALGWAEAVLDVPERWLSAEPRDVVFNGAVVRIATGRSALALPALLDRLQASCGSRAAIPSQAGLREGVLRIEGASRGLVACFDLGTERPSAEALLARLARACETGDLAQIGPLRVVRAEARRDGTFFVLAASMGALPLAQLFPQVGDAPGSDLPHVGRPLRARRLLTVWQQEGEPTLRAYESADALVPAWDGFRDVLRARGVAALGAAVGDATSRAGLFERDGNTLLISAHARGARTLFVVSSLDGGPAANEGANSRNRRVDPAIRGPR